MSDYRIEHDSMGEVRVPAAAKWQAQTQRAVENFPISGSTVERSLIAALAAIKGAAALENPSGRRRIPHRRLPDGFGDVDQHEHERGAGDPGVGEARLSGASQR
jgi:hypothetical protein